MRKLREKKPYTPGVLIAQSEQRTESIQVGEYKVTITVEGPCQSMVENASGFLMRAAEIKSRDFPASDAPKKPCGCSGS